MFQFDLLVARFRIRANQALYSVSMAQERALQVRVSEKRKGAVEIGGNLRHLLLRRHILIVAQRGAMENLKTVNPLRSLGQASQIFGVFGLNNRLSPKR